MTALRSWELTETGSKPHHAPRMRAQSVKVTSRVQTWASKSRYSHARTFQSKILQHLLSLRSAFMCLCRLCPAPHPGPTSSFACVHDREAGADCVLAISELVCFGPHVREGAVQVSRHGSSFQRAWSRRSARVVSSKWTGTEQKKASGRKTPVPGKTRPVRNSQQI